MSTEQPRVRVYVADNHPVFREGIARAVKERPEFELVGQTADGRAALQGIRELEPDVAVLDVRMPGLDGTEILGALVRDDLPTRALMLSAYEEGALVYKALSEGASGYLSKDASRETICDAVAAIARGETVFGHEVQAGVAKEIRLRGVKEKPILTPREREILVLTGEGLSAPEIGQRLYLSPATVKTHLQHLYEKLGVSDRAAAIAEAMRRGLIE